MKKIFLIGWKDVTLAFRDRAALVLMLAAPLLLTLGLGFVTGSFGSSSGSTLQDIPVILVNLDDGQLGKTLVDVFQSNDLKGLVLPTLLQDPAQARQLIDQDKSTAAIIIPTGFTQSVLPIPGTTTSGKAVQIELYTNPSRPTTVGVIKTILEQFINKVEMGRIGGEVTIGQLIDQKLIAVQDANRIGQAYGERQANLSLSDSSIALTSSTGGNDPIKFNALAYMAPGMALMFLMYTVSNGGRTLLTERNQGTLPRLLVAPISSGQVLAGKVFGIFLTGAAQMLILVFGSGLLFGLNWGNPLAVIILVLAAVIGAVGWGMLITALAKTPGQVSAVGSAIMLTFGLLGGSFFNISMLPGWFQAFSKITPNAWGLDGFTTLALGGNLNNILGPLVALIVMGIVLFSIAVMVFNRRGMAA